MVGLSYSRKVVCLSKDSLYINIPKPLAALLNIKYGSELKVSLEDKRVIIERVE